MKRFLTTLLFSALFLCSGFINAQNEAVIERVRQQSTELGKATVNGNWEVLADYTPDSVIELIGGRDQLIMLTKMTFDENAGMNIVSVDVGEEIIVSKRPEGYHALVPKTSVMDMQGMRLINNSFLFGFGDEEGQNWQFIEADQLSADTREILFPGFETDIVIPESSNEMIDLDTMGELGEGESIDELVEEIKEELEKELEIQEEKELSKDQKRIKRKGK